MLLILSLQSTLAYLYRCKLIIYNIINYYVNLYLKIANLYLNYVSLIVHKLYRNTLTDYFVNSY